MNQEATSSHNESTALDINSEDIPSSSAVDIVTDNSPPETTTDSSTEDSATRSSTPNATDTTTSSTPSVSDSSISLSTTLPDTSNSSLPKPLTELYDDSYKLLSEEDLLSKAAEIFKYLSLSDGECINIEASTRLQRNCNEWMMQRRGRITASSFHDVYALKRTTSPIPLCNRLLNPKDLSMIPAIKWGNDNEGLARQQYVNELSPRHENLRCKPSGLVVNPRYPHLGASPDGVISCSCCGTWILEIKCPYSGRHSHPDVLCGDPKSFLNSQGLIRTHKYYTQVQGQLLLCDKEYCDFVVWTTKGMLTERIYIDVRFTEKLLNKLTQFYVENLLPFIITQRYLDDLSNENHEDSSSEVYCICQGPESGKMIECDNRECKYKWFHFNCVGIKWAPKGEWFCPNCNN